MMDIDPGIRIHPAQNITNAWMEIKGSAGTATQHHTTTQRHEELRPQALQHTSLSSPLSI
jgi:hypothetical protein